MLAFAGNSLLCRLALKHAGIDPASFTSVRLLAGAGVLFLLVGRPRRSAGSWASAFALFAYAAAFSFAYVNLEAGTGALLLFGAVQLTMIGCGCWRGERLRMAQWFGLALGMGGLAALLLPGASAPPAVQSSLLMLMAGVAWGVYSLRGAWAKQALGSDVRQLFAGIAVCRCAQRMVLARVLARARRIGAGSSFRRHQRPVSAMPSGTPRSPRCIRRRLLPRS